MQFLQNRPTSFEALSKTLVDDSFVVKTQGSLYLVTNPRGYPNPENDSVRRQLRGVILEKETNKIVAYGLDHDIEVRSEKDLQDLPYYCFDPEINEMVVEDAIDGTLIRMYYYNNQWNYATNRCIDASKSFWVSERSFKDLFLEAAERCSLDTNLLNKHCTYTFVLCHPENRNVKKYSFPSIYHIGTRLNNTQETDHSIGIQAPKSYEFDSWESILQRANELPFFQEGFIVKVYVSNMIYRIKVVNKKFTDVHAIKGNHRNPAIHYVSTVRIMGQDAIDRYLKYFPEHTAIFASTEALIRSTISYLHKEYINFFVDHSRTQIDPVAYKVLSMLHSRYKETQEKTTKEVIAEVVGTLDNEGPVTLAALLGLN